LKILIEKFSSIFFIFHIFLEKQKIIKKKKKSKVSSSVAKTNVGFTEAAIAGLAEHADQHHPVQGGLGRQGLAFAWG
jgi:hypothetical protein